MKSKNNYDIIYTLMSENGDSIFEGVIFEMVDCGSSAQSYAEFAGEGRCFTLIQKNLKFHGTDILVKGEELEKALKETGGLR